MSASIVIMAGGTGGHVFPGLAVAEELLLRGHTIEWLGTERGIESSLVPDAGIPLHTLPVSGVRGKGWKVLFAAPYMLFKSVIAALQVLRSINPALVLGFGGFAAGPGALACRILGKQLLIHEQNSVLGTTNKYLQYIASRRLEGFPETFSRRNATYYTGNPVRKNITASAEDGEFAQALPHTEAERRILVVGGSRGARALNLDLPSLLAQCQQAIACRLKIVHQTGTEDQAGVTESYAALNLDAEVRPFIDDMSSAYQWADLVICRAGAMTVTELAVVGRPAVLVPFPHAIDDHQTKNALWLVQQKAALLLPQTSLSDADSADQLAVLLSDSERLAECARAARAAGIGDAATRVTHHCIEMLEA